MAYALAQAYFVVSLMAAYVWLIGWRLSALLVCAVVIMCQCI
jgi:hypothetical protein